jgi:hypothetical protein
MVTLHGRLVAQAHELRLEDLRVLQRQAVHDGLVLALDAPHGPLVQKPVVDELPQLVQLRVLKRRVGHLAQLVPVVLAHVGDDELLVAAKAEDVGDDVVRRPVQRGLHPRDLHEAVAAGADADAHVRVERGLLEDLVVGGQQRGLHSLPGGVRLVTWTCTIPAITHCMCFDAQ